MEWPKNWTFRYVQQQNEIDHLVCPKKSQVINDIKSSKVAETQLLGCSPDDVYQENGTIRAMVWIQND